ncbi:MAG: hypothetical protein LBB40_05895 [Holophagales bacterium]|nr:hypothetical protein [Holophagales bacterium]
MRRLYLTEEGLYFFVCRSDKPKARAFQEWIAGEVLPSIRKTGGYSVGRTEAPDADGCGTSARDDVWLSVPQAARRVGENERTIYNRVTKDTQPHIERRVFGGAVKVGLNSLLRHLSYNPVSRLATAEAERVFAVAKPYPQQADAGQPQTLDVTALTPTQRLTVAALVEQLASRAAVPQPSAGKGGVA